MGITDATMSLLLEALEQTRQASDRRIETHVIASPNAQQRSAAETLLSQSPTPQTGLRRIVLIFSLLIGAAGAAMAYWHWRQTGLAEAPGTPPLPAVVANGQVKPASEHKIKPAQSAEAEDTNAGPTQEALAATSPAVVAAAPQATPSLLSSNHPNTAPSRNPPSLATGDPKSAAPKPMTPPPSPPPVPPQANSTAYSPSAPTSISPTSSPAPLPAQLVGVTVLRPSEDSEKAAEARYLEAWHLAQRREVRPAIALLQQNVSTHPEHAKSRLLLAELQVLLGEPMLALQTIDSGTSWGEHRTAAALLRARAFLSLKQWEAAQNIAQKMIQQGIRVSDFLAVRAASALGQHRWSEAATDYRKLLELQPREPRWWMGLALALEGMGQVDMAMSARQRASTLSNPTPHN